MCRLYGFHSNEETKVECSLVHAQNALMKQSESDALGRTHADGWGVAYYENSHPTIVRRDLAAFEDRHFSHTAEKMFTNTVVAHVRLATVGEPKPHNAHPFHYGCWAFAHNGTVREFDTVRPWMLEDTEPWLQDLRGGSTDSEHVFHWLLSRINAHGIGLARRRYDPSLLVDIVADSVDTIADWCQQAGAQKPAKLNFVLTDGRILIATRFNHTLYFVRREGLRDCELCGIPHVHHDPHVDYRAVVVASEKITHEEWHTVPNGGLVFVDEDSHQHEYLIEDVIGRPLTGLVAEEPLSCH